MVRQTRKRKYTGQPMSGPPAGPPLPAGPPQAGLPPQVQQPAGPPQAQVQPPAGPPLPAGPPQAGLPPQVQQPAGPPQAQFQPPAGPPQQAPPPSGTPHVHPAQLVVTPPVAPQILVPQPQIQDMPIIEQIPPIDGLPQPVQNPVQPPAIGFHLGYASVGPKQQTQEPQELFVDLPPSSRSGLETHSKDQGVPLTMVQGPPNSKSESIWSLGCSPLNVDKITEYLKLYPSKQDAFILQEGIRNGFKLGFKGSQQALDCNNLLSAKLHKDEVRNKLAKEINLGRIAGPFHRPPMGNLKLSPIGLVPKSEGGWRLIIHLSHPVGNSVNDGFDADSCSVKYTSFDKVTDMIFRLGKGALMAKRDIEGAFRLLRIYPGDFHLLGMRFENKYYIDKCLPMGLAKAPLLFEKFSTFIHWLVSHNSGLNTLDHYLDDFIFAGSSNSFQCSQLVSTFENICSELGIPIAVGKSVGPTTVLIFLGFELDSEEMVIRIPFKKSQELTQELVACMEKKRLTLRELQSLVGKLSFFSQAVRSSRAFLRRFYDAMAGLSKPFYKLRVNQELREDMGIWVNFLQQFNGVVHIPSQIWHDSGVLELFTDSAGSGNLGCGCYFSGKWSFFQWPSSWKGHDILKDMTFLEMVPVVLAMLLWGKDLRNRRIKFRIDNEALVCVINTQSSKSKRVMVLLRMFVRLAMKYGIIFKAVHIPSTDNGIADSISRKQFTRLKELAPDVDRQPQDIPAQFQSLIYNKKLTDCSANH